MQILNGKTIVLDAVDTTGEATILPTGVDFIAIFAKNADILLHWGDSTVAVGDLAASDPAIPAGAMTPVQPGGTHVALKCLESGKTTDVWLVGCAGRI